MLRRVSLLAPIALFTACTSSGDEVPPTLEVTSPERGTLSDSSIVMVTGTASDDVGVRRVTVNGVAVPIDVDGRFSAEVDLRPGVEVIETIVEDDAGNRARDVRAVLSGDLAPTTSRVDDAIGARIGAGAFRTIADTAARIVEGMDLGALARPMNPVVSRGGSCLGVDVDVLDVRVRDVDLGLTPGSGALRAGVQVDDLYVSLRARYRVACLAGTKDFTVTATRIGLDGRLGLRIAGTELESSLSNVLVTIHGLDLDTTGIPGSIVDLLEGPLEAAMPGILESVITDAVPPLVDGALADLTGTSYTVPALSHTIAVQVAPSAVTIDAGGVFVALDTTLRVVGGEGGMFLSTPATLTSGVIGGGDGLALAVADDAINELFGGLWAAGALDQELHLERGDPLGLLLGDETRSIALSMSLPPTVSMDESGDLRIVIGDLMLRCADDAGGEMATIALSVSTTLGAATTSDQQVTLRMGRPMVWAQVVSQSDRLPRPLDGEQIEAVVRSLYDLVETIANKALAAVPLPSIAGVALVDPGIESRDGYLIVATGLSSN
jgi:hypothetical protein